MRFRYVTDISEANRIGVVSSNSVLIPSEKALIYIHAVNE